MTVPSDMMQMKTREDWSQLSKILFRPLRCSVVKVVMLSNDDIYFMNTNETQHHYVYLQSKINEKRYDLFFFLSAPYSVSYENFLTN